MAGNGVFSLGFVGPLILLFLGFVAIGLSFSGALIVARLRANSEHTTGKSQPKIDMSIAFLGVSALLPILAGVPSHFGAYGAGLMLGVIGPFLLWPNSAVLAIQGRGTGRRVLLVGTGSSAFWWRSCLSSHCFAYISRGIRSSRCVSQFPLVKNRPKTPQLVGSPVIAK